MTRTAAFRAGLRAGAPFAFAGFLLSLSFGVLARDAGMPAAAVIVMSLIVFAGSAQFAAISILAAGGGIGAAVAASAMMNSRFLAMGIALAPSLPGGPWKRAAQGQAIVDSSWAMSAKGDGTFDRVFLFGATAVQYVTWQAGTLLGALSGNLLGDVHKLGLDAVYPAFFLAILMVELRRPGGAVVALLGALIALVLIPFTPAGVPVLASSVAAFYGLLLRRGGRDG